MSRGESRGEVERKLRETEVLLEILRPVMEVFAEERWVQRWIADGGEEGDDEGSDGEARLEVLMRGLWATDKALMVHYKAVDPVLDAREAAVRAMNMSAWGNGLEPINNYKALHVLVSIQETWLVKFEAIVSSHDTWGRVFLGALRGFGEELQKLSATMCTWVSTPGARVADESDEARFGRSVLNAQWGVTARQFYSVLLMLFDVGLGLAPGHNEYTGRANVGVEESAAFSSRSVVRGRVLGEAAFITHLETCACKVVLMLPSYGHRVLGYAAADGEVSDRVYRGVERVRDGFKTTLDRLRRAETGRRVSAAASEALAWREQYRDGAGTFAQGYARVLAELQQDLAVRLALAATAQREEAAQAAGAGHVAGHALPAGGHGPGPEHTDTHAKLSQLLALLA